MKEREQLLTKIIQAYGFEHPITISIATMTEDLSISLETLRATIQGLLEMRTI